MESRRANSIRAFDDGIDRWEMVAAAPAAALRDRVSHYCHYHEETRSFAARRELAATSGVLIYALREPLEITGVDGRVVTVGAGQAFAGGIADATSVSRALGPQTGIHVFLPLSGLATVCGVPLAEIANCVAPFRDLVGEAADTLGGRLVEAAGPDARFALLDRFLEDRFARDPDRDRAAEWAMRRLAVATRPVTTRLATEIGWSRKHLNRRFRDLTGFTPDRFRRLARFERFTAAISRLPGDSLAGLASDCGYVDQAHLTRDVRDFADMTPGELRARLLPEGAGIRHE